MEKRHQEYVLLYNAECDAICPMSAADCAREIEKRELGRDRANNQMDVANIRRNVITRPSTDKAANAADAAMVNTNYIKANQSEFDKLLAGRLGARRGQDGASGNGYFGNRAETVGAELNVAAKAPRAVPLACLTAVVDEAVRVDKGTSLSPVQVNAGVPSDSRSIDAVRVLESPLLSRRKRRCFDDPRDATVVAMSTGIINKELSNDFNAPLKAAPSSPVLF